MRANERTRRLAIEALVRRIRQLRRGYSLPERRGYCGQEDTPEAEIAACERRIREIRGEHTDDTASVGDVRCTGDSAAPVLPVFDADGAADAEASADHPRQGRDAAARESAKARRP